MYKFKFYSKSILEHVFIPNFYYQKQLRGLLSKDQEWITKIIIPRVNYYFKRITQFHPAEDEFIKLSDLSCFRKSAYYFDIRSVLRYYSNDIKFQCWLRDVITVPDNPRFVKCRPIGVDNANSAILKLNQVRHYRKIADKNLFAEKKAKLVWRGSVYQRGWRAEFIKKLFNNPFCDVGALKGTAGVAGSQFEKEFLSINEQLKYKFIFSIEGADVATNLKWIAQSNSLCFMKKPKHESWFMEDKLVAGEHYVEVDDTFDDITDKIQYYLEKPEEAEEIISNMQEYYSQFQNMKNEKLTMLLVALKYFFLSGQISLDDLNLGFLKNEFIN